MTTSGTGPDDGLDGSDPAPTHPGRARGTHAAPPTKLRLLLRSMAAVALVAALVAALLQWRGQDTPTTGSDGPGPVVVVPTPSPTMATPTPSGTTTPTARPAPARTTAAPSPTRVVLPLGVYNNSRRTGLAARAAAEYRRGGWPAESKGNYRASRLPATTVYYTAGSAREQLAAESLHRQFPQVERVRARVAGIPGTGLAVILTADYPG